MNTTTTSDTRRSTMNTSNPFARGAIINGKRVEAWNADESNLEIPLRWRKPRRIFVNSMSDLFHRDVPFEFIDHVFAVMACAERHTFQVLTKRPDRMAEYLATRAASEYRQWHRAGSGLGFDLIIDNIWTCDFPLASVWLGTSIEDQPTADERIPHLLRCPAAVRFLSCEPLLGPLDLAFGQSEGLPTESEPFRERADLIHWVIVGGESGKGARPMQPDWALSLRDQCAAAGVPFFFKQWGEFLPGMQDGAMFDNHQHINISDTPMRIGKKKAGRLLDGREHNEFPEVPA